MQGRAIAEWVKRHSPGERFSAGLSLSDAAMTALVERLRDEGVEAPRARDVVAYLKRQRHEE